MRAQHAPFLWLLWGALSTPLRLTLMSAVGRAYPTGSWKAVLLNDTFLSAMAGHAGVISERLGAARLVKASFQHQECLV